MTAELVQRMPDVEGGVSPSPRKFRREPEISTLDPFRHGFMVSDFP